MNKTLLSLSVALGVAIAGVAHSAEIVPVILDGDNEGYKDPTPGDYKKVVEALESMTDFAEGPAHPQGPKKFNGKLHQCYGHQYVSKVEGRKLKVVHRTKIEDSLYDPEADYTKQPL